MREQDILVLEIYAEALADAAAKANLVETVFEECCELQQILSEHPELVLFLDKPAIEQSDKKTLLRNVFEGRLSPLMLNLGLMLIDKYRGGMWPGILEHFIAWAERERGIFPAKVSTAHSLSDEERKNLSAALEKFTGHKLRIQFKDDPSLVAGVVFRSGDTLIDKSVRGGLNELHARLKSVKID